MKPLTLVLKNIGPFLHETIDFTTLDDIFIITGNTGSGKTTILDAITYALYGDLAGSRGGKNINLHSDYVPNTEQGFVTFTFLLHGITYRINRTVPYEVVNKKGESKKRSAEVVFECFDTDQKTWQLISDKTQDVLEAVVERIGLKKDEFAKIVFLPQGEFARFLSETSAKKEETLAKLFPIEQYKGICEAIAHDAKTKEIQVKQYASILENEKQGYDDAATDLELQQLQSQLEAIHQAESEYSEQIQLLTSQQNKLQQDLKQAQDVLTWEKQLADLEAQQPEIEGYNQKCAAAKNALQVKDALTNKDHVQKELADCEADLRQKDADLQQIILQKNALEEQRQKYTEDKSKLENIGVTLSMLQDRITKATKYAEHKKTYETQVDLLTSLYAKVVPAWYKSQKEELSLQNSIVACTTAITEKQNQITQLKEEETNAHIHSLAYTLAAQLQDDTPCPVCGSVHHPRLAQPIGEIVDYKNQINLLQDEITDINASITHTNATLASLSTAKGILEQECTSIEEIAICFSIALPDKSALPERTAPVPSMNHIADMQKQISNIQMTLSSSRSLMKECDKEGATDIGGLQEQVIQTQNEKTELTKAVASFEKQERTLADNQARVQGQIDSLNQSRNSFEHDYHAAVAEFEKQLQQTAFTDEASVRNALLSSDELNRLETICHTFAMEMEKTRALLSQASVSSSQITDLQSDIDLISTKISNLDVLHTERQNQLQHYTQRQTLLIKKKETVAECEKRYHECLAEFEPLALLDKDINGGNAKKQNLYKWILGTYFEEVVNAASARFNRMSSGRYTLQLETDRQGGRGEKGLDITVIDSYTGKNRTVDTLSGGEIFEASLSLALALTDVVQQKSGGVSLDSLFIDEGFGSLDPETLDNAISVIDQIREHRLVGIISHVEQLAQAISCHVAVEKTESGSIIRINQ